MIITKEYAEKLREKNISPSEYRDLLVQELYILSQVSEELSRMANHTQIMEERYSMFNIKIITDDTLFGMLKELYRLDNEK